MALRIAFTAMHLTERGTTTALFDYAHYNVTLLGNQSIILYQRNHPATFHMYEAIVKRYYEYYTFDSFEEVDTIVKEKKIDALYIIKSGQNDGRIAKNCPTLVHAVFVSEPHGDRYAFISEWLSSKYGKKIPCVPHMISLPQYCLNPDENLREELHIPKDAIVFGGYGGRDSFDIPFVHRVIERIVTERPDVYFLFMNFDRSTAEHPQIIYLPPSIDKEYKIKFIQSCDAMIHARSAGESFGLAVGEFSSFNKPVITFKCDAPYYDKEHIRILGYKGIYYTNADNLYLVLRDFSRDITRGEDWNAYRDYAPGPVMKIFHNVFLKDLIHRPCTTDTVWAEWNSEMDKRDAIIAEKEKDLNIPDCVC